MDKNIRHKIAELHIIWLKPISEIAHCLNIRYIDTLNYTKSKEYKNFERKWIYKRTETHHDDLFTMKTPKLTHKKLIEL